MIRTGALLMVTAISFGVATTVAGAHADERTCVLDTYTGLLKCSLVASPSPPLTVRVSDDLPLVWVRTPLNSGELIARGLGCVRSVNGATQIGVGYVVSLNNTATGEQLDLRYVCSWPEDPPPTPPPPPPTSAEFADANAQALTLQPALSPTAAIGGITGLESWLWCNDPGPVGTGVTLRGWTATGQVRVVDVRWHIGGDDGTATTSTSCGSEAAPSETWTPQTAGEHSVQLTTVWAGSWDLSWNGIPMGTFPLGPISLSTPPQTYTVDEYRGELTG